jgi:ATP-dependent Clp protease ATP-binding subunit ClpA
MYTSSLENRGVLNYAFQPFQAVAHRCDHFAAIIHDSFIGTAFYSVKNLFVSSAMAKEIAEIAKKNPKELQNSAPLVAAFNSKEFPQVRAHISKILRGLDDQFLDGVLRDLFADQVNKQPELLVKRLNHLLTLEKVEQAVRSKIPRFKNTAQAAMDEAGPVSRDLGAKAKENQHHLIRLTKHYISSTFEWVMDTMMNVLMLTDITDGDATKLEKQMIKAMQFTALLVALDFLTSWMSSLIIFTGSVLSATAIFSVIGLSLIAFGIIYVKYLKPPPAHLHPATNLTELAIKGKLPPAVFREDIVAKIVTHLHINATIKNFRQHVLIVGESGVGKSLIINQLAKVLADGNVDPSLKDLKVVYSANASDLVDGQGTPEHWELIRKNLENYEKNALLFIDEIQGAVETDERKVLANLLLTAMDLNGMPFMIFACTKQDYETHLTKNKAFLRRVTVIDVKSLDEEQTFAILAKEIKEDAPGIFIPHEVLEKVAYLSKIEGCADVFGDCPQPLTSKRILYTAIAQKHMQKINKLEDLLREKSKRDLIDSKLESLNNPTSYSDEGAELYAQLEGEDGLDQKISKLESEIEDANNKLNAFKSLLKKLSDLTNRYKHMSLDIKKAWENKKSSKSQLKEFLLLKEYQKKALEETIVAQRDQLGDIYPEITLDDIDQYIAAEAASLRQAKEDLQAQLNSI